MIHSKLNLQQIKKILRQKLAKYKSNKIYNESNTFKVGCSRVFISVILIQDL